MDSSSSLKRQVSPSPALKMKGYVPSTVGRRNSGRESLYMKQVPRDLPDSNNFIILSCTSLTRNSEQPLYQPTAQSDFRLSAIIPDAVSSQNSFSFKLINNFSDIALSDQNAFKIFTNINKDDPFEVTSIVGCSKNRMREIRTRKDSISLTVHPTPVIVLEKPLKDIDPIPKDQVSKQNKISFRNYQIFEIKQLPASLSYPKKQLNIVTAKALPRDTRDKVNKLGLNECKHSIEDVYSNDQPINTINWHGLQPIQVDFDKQQHTLKPNFNDAQLYDTRITLTNNFMKISPLRHDQISLNHILDFKQSQQQLPNSSISMSTTFAKPQISQQFKIERKTIPPDESEQANQSISMSESLQFQNLGLNQSISSVQVFKFNNISQDPLNDRNSLSMSINILKIPEVKSSSIPIKHTIQPTQVLNQKKLIDDKIQQIQEFIKARSIQQQKNSGIPQRSNSIQKQEMKPTKSSQRSISNGRQKDALLMMSQDRNSKLSQFIRLKYLGKGKFSDVYSVIERRTGSIYALKLIQKSIIASKGIARLMMDEIKIQSYLDHPNVLKLYGVIDDHKQIGLLLEYCKHSLTEYLKFNVDRVRIANQLLESLAYIHSQGVIHRDLKPENILINEGVLKIADFGISIKNRTSHQYCGTIGFMAPEVIQKQEYDSKVDCFSAGVIIKSMGVLPNIVSHLTQTNAKIRFTAEQAKKLIISKEQDLRFSDL